MKIEVNNLTKPTLDVLSSSLVWTHMKIMIYSFKTVLEAPQELLNGQSWDCFVNYSFQVQEEERNFFTFSKTSPS